MRTVSLLFLLGGCHTWTPDDRDALSGGSAQQDSRYNGTSRFVFEVPEGATHLIFTAQVDYPYGAYIISLTDPDGVRVYDAEATWSAPYNLTGAVASQWVVSLNYPILDTDPPLKAGRYRALVGVVEPAAENDFRRGVPIRASFHTKSDVVPGGRLAVNLIYADGAEARSDWVASVTRALDGWSELYAQAGIELEVSTSVATAGPLRVPGRGNADDYQLLAEAGPLRSVNVVLVPEIVDGPDLYGIAGGIPGPLVPSAQSAVTVSLLLNAGPDAQYSAAEERLLAETLAHEVGHYLGLFHPVEVTWESWDALQDTPDCTRESECNQVLGDNLMYPYPLCAGGGDCAPQPNLTPQQEALANRYVGVW